MQDSELYRRILGIEAPWCVERAELKLADGEAHVYLDHHEMTVCGMRGAGEVVRPSAGAAMTAPGVSAADRAQAAGRPRHGGTQ